jgi:hypothetical protein
MEVALELASAIAARQPGTEIIVLSDGKVDLPQRLAIKGMLRYIPFGLSAENQAISLFSLQTGQGTQTAFIQVKNYGNSPASCRLSVYTDEQLFTVIDLTNIPPGGEKSAIADGIASEATIVRASIENKDAFALDNQAYAIRAASQPAPVTLVTQGNRFIRTALSLLPGVQLTEQVQETATPDGSPTPTANPTSPTPSPTLPAGGSTPASLYIYDNTTPDVVPPAGSLLFIAPPRSTEFFTTTGLIENPVLRPVDMTDPLLQNLSLTGINILDAVQIPLPAWATPVAAGDLPEGNTPLIFRGTVNGRRIAVIAFDFRHSDLPLQVAFPVLWANLVEWLAPGASSAIPEQVAPGENISFVVPQDVTSASVTGPDGVAIPIQTANNHFVIHDTTALGVYTIHMQGQAAGSSGEKQAAFAVNLFSPQESEIEPRDNLPGVEAVDNPTGLATNRAVREWWRIPALAALGALIGEWLVYQRAALARLRDLLRRSTRKFRLLRR